MSKESSAVSLVLREPQVTVEQLMADLVPPPTFANVSFDSYIADPLQPTQKVAVDELRNFAQQINNPPRRFFRRESVSAGRYLDGGFGVGKTHLLASLFHAVEGKKAFGTFVEYTNLVGALGFHVAVERLSEFKLVCIDEFELDDPGDTVLMSTLLMRLVEQGVSLAATSNTLPDRLGEERFAAEDFQREIQGLAAHFTSLRVDGEDYRHRGLPEAPAPRDDEYVRTLVHADAALDDFAALTKHLSVLHPSKYKALVADITALHLVNVQQLHDQAAALRWVVLIDRLYDRGIPVVNSGVSVDQLFAPELLRGGYRKKYRRALSRIVALTRLSDVGRE